MCSACLSSCSLFGHGRLKEVTFNGNKYKSGIQGVENSNSYLHNQGLRQPKSKPLFTIIGWNFWASNDYYFDILYCEHEDSVIWNPYIYVKANDYEKADKYYHDISNFDYYIGKLYSDDLKLVENENETVYIELEKALDLLTENKLEKENVNSDFVSKDSYVIYRYSNDGLFCKGNEPQLVISEQRFYCFLSDDGLTGKQTLGVISDQMNTFLINLFKQYGII